VTESFGHRFIEHGDRLLVRPLLKLNAEAIIDNLQLADEREEIRGWYRLGETPEFGDGLWQGPMNQPAWELWSAFAMPSVFKLPGIRQFAVHRYLLTQRGTRHIALICGRFKNGPTCTAPVGSCSSCGSRWRSTKSTCSRWARCSRTRVT
jgi:hypothetical protein